MQEYLLDTNAYFKVLCFINGKTKNISNECLKEIKKVLTSNCYISQITLIEIISVIGKYARGANAQKDKCNCIVSETGDICENFRFTPSKRKWNSREVNAWIKLTKDIVNGRSSLLKIKVIDLSCDIIIEAEKFIEHSLRYKFGSMDSIIAATVIDSQKKGKNLSVITSDKSLKAGMAITNIPYSDVFKEVIFCA